LPDDSTHIVKADGFAKLDYFGSYWDNFVSAVVNRASELITDVYAQPTALMQDPIAFFPNEV
jgi:hypothetical protein